MLLCWLLLLTCLSLSLGGEAADASHDLQIEKASVDLAGLNRNVRTPEGAKDKKGNGKKNKAKGKNNKRRRKANKKTNKRRSQKKNRKTKIKNKNRKTKIKNKNRKSKTKNKNRKTRKQKLKKKKNKVPKKKTSKKNKRKSKKRKQTGKKNKSKSNSKRKIKLKRKSKKKKKNKNRQSSGSCTNEVSTKCLENALISLAYEKNQVTNYIKQAKRLENHQKISTNKLSKNDEFQSAAKHMLWAIGGNLSDPKCGEETNDTKRAARQQRGLKDSIANYQKLFNCSNSIAEACDITLKNDTYDKDGHAEELEKCRFLKSDFINVSKECVSKKDQANATLQCECWARAAKDVADIKKLKCETKSKQKLVTEHKNQCIKAFGKCKKMEDEAIELIHICMHDHSNDFINQTAAGLNQAAEEAGREELKRRLLKIGFDSII